ncbi:hypothetical protein D5F01_LYC21654 [Larimichthys crocea]|uniref:C2H2-type domain-containing protein n=1 Tax=Larimichthys crocea TaxID=215358 RepID=A0A6G0HPY2_LARCR|nr:hypothetical protein D5F01_LYC21654 [Larimichthys crocea]
MAGTQLLRLQVNERLAAAAEEIFGLVEKTIAEYQDEVVRSRTEIIQLRKQLEQLTVLKPEVMLFRAEIQLVSEEILPSQQPDQLPTVVKTEALDSQQVHVEVDTVPPLCPSDTKQVSENLFPSLERCDIKVEQIQEYPQVKEEQVEQCISPDMEADTSNNAEVRLPKSELTSDFDLFPSSAAVTVGVNENIDDKQDESDGSPMLCCDSEKDQSQSVEVHMELEQHQRDKKSCRFCSDTILSDSALRRHMQRFHKGQKAFKCLTCNKEFDLRHHLIQHVRIHTGEKPFGCNYCEKTFNQHSSRAAHMRRHTTEKPYYCAKCGKSFASSSHFKICKVKANFESAPEKVNTDKNPKVKEKTFKCSECSKMFRRKPELIQHQRIHTGEKPFSCNLCCKTFTQISTRNAHMRVHTGEKPYLCKNCGKSFATRKHLKLCTALKKSETKSFHCTACGKFFHTETDLNAHMQVHELWRRHMSKKLREQE